MSREYACAHCGATFDRLPGRIDLLCSTECRFWSKVDKSGPVPPHAPHLGPCWVWTAGTMYFGRGAFRFGRHAKANAARVAWELTNGDPGDGFEHCVCHRCDNPACVNPGHLFLGTQGANMRDRNVKGRHTHGERSPNAVLDENDVRAIRDAHSAGESTRALAKRFGVSPTLVRMVANRSAWKHVA